MKFFNREWRNGELSDERYNEVVLSYETYFKENLNSFSPAIIDFNNSHLLHDAKMIDQNSTENGLTLNFAVGNVQTGYKKIRLRYENAVMNPELSAALDVIATNNEFECTQDEFHLSPMDGFRKFQHNLYFWPGMEIEIMFDEMFVAE